MSSRLMRAGLFALLPTSFAYAADPAVDIPEITISAKALDAARNGLSPQLGASTYQFDQASVLDLPQGPSTSLNQMLYQAPGVVQNSLGQMHVRGEHGNLQYRLNGVLLPEGISGFGPTLDGRILDSMTLITGTLPAQYGIRTAGIIDVHTKSGAIDPGGSAEIRGGSHGTIAPAFDWGSASGPWALYTSGSFAHSDVGIEAPIKKYAPLHDGSDQTKGFAYLSYATTPFARVDVVVGSSVNRFDIPNNPNQTPTYTLTGYGTLESAKLRASQVEQSHWGIVALQLEKAEWSTQLAPFIRFSQTHYHPDIAGDLEFTGVASDVSRSNTAVGLQSDSAWRGIENHVIRMGGMVQHERMQTANTSQAFSVDAGGNQTSSNPLTILDNSHKEGLTFGLYVQDEWHLTDQLTVNGGVRFDQVDAYVAENQISPRLGLVFQATPATALHAGYARNFTPPPLELIGARSLSKYQDTSAQASSTTNDAVKAERTHSFDAGISHQADDHIKLGLDGYLKLSRNLLDEGQFGSALLYTPFNYRIGRVMGIEGTACYTAKDTSGYLNLALSRAMGKDIVSSQFTFTDADEFDYIRSHWVHLDHDQLLTLSSGIAQQIDQWTRLSLDLILGTGLHRGFANGDTMPVYTQVDLGATRHLAVDETGLDLRLAVVNLLDTPYQINDGSGIGITAPHWGPRRSFYLTLSRAF